MERIVGEICSSVDTALLILNGYIPPINFVQNIVAQSKDILCTDGAANTLLKYDILPDELIGDMDSINVETSKYLEDENIKMQRFLPEKDMTDSHIALMHLINLGYKRIFVIGAVGSRWDHSLCNISMLKLALDYDVETVILDEKNYISSVKPGEYKLINQSYKYFSIIPFNDKISGLTIKGAKYDLNGKDIKYGDSIGISNEIVGEVYISFKNGEMLIMLSSE